MFTRLLPVLALTSVPALAQNIVPVAYESFDYTVNLGIGNGNGYAGAGWFTEWWSGNNGDHAIITSPSLDSVGAKLTTNIENQGTFRLPATGPHQDIAPSGQFGSADGVMWFRFRSQRVDPAGDVYGGFSLFTQFGAEHIFLGCPGGAEEWGIEDPATGNRATVPGTDPDIEAQIVVRITFTGAGETVDMWVDPASTHPTTTPDATLLKGDFEWNECRFQSGASQGGVTGWHFDELVIEKEVATDQVGTTYCFITPNSAGPGASITATGSGIAANNDVTLHMTGLPTNQFCLFIAARVPGYVQNPGGAQGNICIGSPIARFSSAAGYSLPNSGATGTVSQQINLGSIPLTPAVPVLPGETWCFQGWYRDNNPTPTSNFSDAIFMVFQ
jgi:hypothetical protein